MGDGRNDHQHDHGASNTLAVSATLHCLTGCAIGEVLGLVIGTALGLATATTIVLAVGLAFFFGYLLSTAPLLKAGLGLWGALSVVLAADTLSIATMELVDNLVMATLPGALEAGLGNPTFWIGMPVALTAAFFAALPVNKYLLSRGKGHALTHAYHSPAHTPDGWRRFIPDVSTGALVAVIAAFMLGGLTVSVVESIGGGDPSSSSEVSPTPGRSVGAQRVVGDAQPGGEDLSSEQS